MEQCLPSLPQQRCPLSHLLFILIVKGLNKLIKEAYKNGNFKGVNIGTYCNITHLLFIDGILLFREGSKWVIEKFKGIFDLFCKATGMTINLEKSMISPWGITKQENNYITVFPY
jgi:hypothetical protein